jgi:antibiotic biosynthesis monooxygenase (ABM) superfamily enzyme
VDGRDPLRCAGPREAWFESAERKTLTDDVEHLLKRPEEVNTVAGLEFWFERAPPASSSC